MRGRIGRATARIGGLLLAGTALAPAAASESAAASPAAAPPDRAPAAAQAAGLHSSPAPRANAKPSDDGPQPGEQIPPSYEFDGVPQAGTFFWTDASGTNRTCSGAVVHSRTRDVVVSAGHCLKGYAGKSPAKRLAFVPGYHDGQRPYGTFPIPVNSIWVDEHYYKLGADAGAEYDVGFARTGRNEHGQKLEDAIGAPGYTLLTDTGYDHLPVHMIGYPGGASHTKPIQCWSRSTKWVSDDPAAPGAYPRVPCADFIGGTSGGPMTVPLHGPSGFGVFGVVGGVHTGGNTSSVSYSAYFGGHVRALFNRAVAGAPPAQP